MTENNTSTKAFVIAGDVVTTTNIANKLLYYYSNHLGLSSLIGITVVIVVLIYCIIILSDEVAKQINTTTTTATGEETDITEKELQDDWRQEDHSRSFYFMVRSVYYHVWIKGKRVLHSIGGMMVLGLALIAFFWIPITGHRAPQIISNFFTVGVLLMSMGQLTPYFQKKKLQRLGCLQLAFHKSMALVVGFSFGIHSIYANETYQKTSSVDGIFTFLYLFVPIISITLYVAELYLQATWSTLKYSVAYSAVVPFIYGPLIYELYAGKEALSTWYNTARVGDAVYLMNISAAFFVSLDMLNLTMVLKRVITIETRFRQTGYMWMFFGMVVINWTLISCIGAKYSAAYFVLFGLYEPIHRLIPARCFSKHKANQVSLRLLTEDNAGLNVTPFVPGTKKII